MSLHRNDHEFPSWDEITAFLGKPDSHPEQPETVERIETHISLIFLAGDVAYKIKKPVVFPFLDYSTPEARRRACINEVQLNRRTAPDLYLGVVPITYDKARGLEIGGSGEVLEWAVKMRRFPEGALYSEMAAAGRLGDEDYSELARAVHTFHDEAARRIEPGTAAGALERLIAENDAAFAEYPDVFSPEDVRALRMELEARLAELTPLLERRTRGGFVRHCHGDLHLRNVVRVEGHPVLFDAVEFDDAIATVDVLDDLAFLLMDLIARGARQGANVVLNAYLSADNDMRNLEGLAALPIYLSTRAGIRAKAAAYQAQSAEARRYFDLARSFMERSAPALIAIGGLSGTGKSTLARALAPGIGSAPGAVILRSDIERKRLFAATETQRLPESAYSARVTETVYRTLAKKARAALRAGHSVILDAVHGKKAERDDVRAVAKETGAEFVGIWLMAPEETLVARVESRESDASDAGAEVVRKQLGFDPGEIAWGRVDASGTPDEVRDRAEDLLRDHVLRDS
jgi:aminoglycoside phosphotransferase family enzyme/cytidylate kinase